jgi:hypothetical protein
MHWSGVVMQEMRFLCFNGFVTNFFSRQIGDKEMVNNEGNPHEKN